MSAFFGDTIKPRPMIPEEVERAVERVADQAGFKNREPLREPPKRRRGTDKQLHSFTMRVEIDDAESFIRWCEQERLSYREGFAKLVATVRG